jgi:hypothetical protein
LDDSGKPRSNKYDLSKVKVSLNGPFPLSLINTNYLRESYMIIKYKKKKQTILPILDTLVMRKMFVYLFWIYYVERYQSMNDLTEGDDLPENILSEVRV